MSRDGIRDTDPLPPTPFEVVCVAPGGQEPVLSDGRRYVVVKVVRSTVTLVELREVPGESFMLARFALVDGSLDWRTWRDQGLEPGHCCCRIPRELCRYHRS